jgi:hypothetical protein
MMRIPGRFAPSWTSTTGIPAASTAHFTCARQICASPFRALRDNVAKRVHRAGPGRSGGGTHTGGNAAKRVRRAGQRWKRNHSATASATSCHCPSSPQRIVWRMRAMEEQHTAARRKVKEQLRVLDEQHRALDEQHAVARGQAEEQLVSLSSTAKKHPSSGNTPGMVDGADRLPGLEEKGQNEGMAKAATSAQRPQAGPAASAAMTGQASQLPARLRYARRASMRRDAKPHTSAHGGGSSAVSL